MRPMIASAMSLAVTPRPERAVHLDQHAFHFLLHQALGGEHVLDLRGADAMRQATEGAVGAGMGIAADDGHARQSGALLRSDDVHDALALVQEGEIDLGAELADVGVQGFDLQAGDRVADALVPVLASACCGRPWPRPNPMRQGLRPASFRPSKACGLVTSCTRWRSM